MRVLFCLSVLIVCCVITAVSADAAAPNTNSEVASSSAPGISVRFDRDVRPILSDKCYFCHGPDKEHRKADLRLDLADDAMSLIEPGDSAGSELISRITATDPDEVMPPPGAHKELTNEEIAILKRWIDDGAEWTQHWSFSVPGTVGVPDPTDSNQTLDPIDAFVAEKLVASGKTFSTPATRQQLIRRVTFDLTGMPPTAQEIKHFVADQSPHAYQHLVDRLLGSPRFGQRMAYMWLDAARYGDTSVYHADGPRDMWAWRDAVVDAYNDNLPFDEFSIAQIAGDLLPDASLQQKVLSGFNRNNGTTDEGGAIAEEYRVEYAVDRVKTTSTVWLGLTMECAQCHDHKYDPISHEDYYRFYGFFNVSDDSGMQTRKGNASPLVEIPDPAKQAKLPGVRLQLTESQKTLAEIRSEHEADFTHWLESPDDSERSNTPLPSDCIVWLTISEGTGKTVGDAIRPDATATVTGKAIWTDSPKDKALKFNGSNFLDLGQVDEFERTDSFSYGGWIKPQKGQSGALLARMDDANSHRGYDMLAGDGPVSVHIINAWPGNAIKVTTKKRLKPDVWQHVFMTYDGSSKASGVKVYVDGEKWDWKIEQDGLTKTIKTTKSLLVGSRHPGSRLKGEVDEVQVFAKELSVDEVKGLANASTVAALLAFGDKRSQTQTETLRNYYLSKNVDEFRSQSDTITKLQTEIDELQKPLTSVMVMGDQSKPRDTFVLNRGAYDSPTDVQVQPGVPSVLPQLSPDMPQNRLGLARWLFRDDNPLTARVTVNRYWQMLLGTGLVSSPEDFGAQGEYPSHPELLDWMATDFRSSGWNIKRMIKQIVLSQTYRQSSHASANDYQADPDNRQLARGSRFRLQGEFIRDAVLSVSGLLNDQHGGPGVKPYQPPGLWAEVGLGGNPKFKQDTGQKLYRRSLYTYWKRSAPPPSMQIFDAPTREKCTIRRARTNTPLQALVTLNDTQFVEAAIHFASRIIAQGGATQEDRIEFGFRLATARTPSESESDVLSGILDSSVQRYIDDTTAAEKLLAIGESNVATESPAELAAWTIVASTLLNLDETLTRE